MNIGNRTSKKKNVKLVGVSKGPLACVHRDFITFDSSDIKNLRDDLQALHEKAVGDSNDTVSHVSTRNEGADGN